jgi:phosphohistidine phosphatase
MDEMNLILWRHSDAGDSISDANADLARKLTDRGRKQAERMSEWLRARLPERYIVISSPALRARETAEALGAKVRLEPRLAPGSDVAHHLAALNWPEGTDTRVRHIVMVGHQPALGRLASLLMSGAEDDWSIKKGAVWWLSNREREGMARVVLRASIAPDLI